MLKTYYTLSPKPAALIAEHPKLRHGARIVLRPIIASVGADGSNSAPAVVGFLIMGSFGAGVGLFVFGLVGIFTRRGKRCMGAWEHGKD